MQSDNQKKENPETAVVKVSWWWLILLGIMTLGLGLTGGIVAQQAFQPDLPPLSLDGNNGVTTVVQEVTVSPNQATAKIVESSARSIFLITQDERPVAMAATLTSDGLVVTASGIKGSLAAYDEEGRKVTVEYVGEDAVLGLTFLRLPQTVVSPLDLRADDAPVGQSLTAVSRDPATFTSRVRTTTINQYELPRTPLAAGIQRQVQTSENLDQVLPGTPLIDEEGRIAALWLGKDTTIPVNLVRAGLDRLSANLWEVKPFEAMGISVTFGFSRLPDDAPVSFVMHVTAVRPNSPASQAGLKAGDEIITLDGKPLIWKEPVINRIPTGQLLVGYVREQASASATIQFTE